MMILNNPFFWALVSMFALVGANAVASKKFGKKLPYGITMVALFALGRLMLVLPFCPQPRFVSGGLHQIIGSIVAILGFIFCVAAFGIKPFTAPEKTTFLRTTGCYKFTRNPIYLGEIL